MAQQKSAYEWPRDIGSKTWLHISFNPGRSSVYNRDYKVVVLGPPSAGKTALIERFDSGTFNGKTTQTLGMSFILKDVFGMYLALWDTAGQERYATLTSFYARDASAAIVCFDLTDPDHFGHLDKWYRYINDAAPNCKHILVGCKMDLIEENPDKRAADPGLARSYAQAKGSFKYIESSSKTGYNIDNIFQLVCEQLRPGSTAGSRASSVSATPTLTKASQPGDAKISLHQTDTRTTGPGAKSDCAC